MALGVAAAQFLTVPANGIAVPIFSTLVIGIGAGLVTTGLWRYLRGVGQIDASAFQPARTSVVVASIVGLAAAVLAIVVAWLLPHT